MNEITSWHQLFIEHAELVSRKSKDRSTKVGAVAVGPDNEIRSVGFNGFPRGIDDNIDERHHRPHKYLWTEHAERNCIYNAVRIGVSLKGCTLYMNWVPVPCADCSRGVIQSGINRIIGPPRPFGGKGDLWESHCDVGYKMLLEASIELFIWDGNKLNKY